MSAYLRIQAPMSSPAQPGNDWRPNVVAGAVAASAAAVIAHFVVRQLGDQMYTPGLVPWVRLAVGASMVVALLPFLNSRRSLIPRTAIWPVLVVLSVAFAIATLRSGRTELLAMCRAIWLGLTAQGLVGLLPLTLISASVTRGLLRGDRASDHRTLIAIALLLPGGLSLPLLSFVSPGNERLFATMLLPAAVVALAVIAWHRAREKRLSYRFLALLAGIALFAYAPVARGVATSGESASLLYALALPIACLRRSRLPSSAEDNTADPFLCGWLVLALLTGIAVHHAVCLTWLAETHARSGTIFLAGVVSAVVVVVACRGFMRNAIAIGALTAPLVVAPAISWAFGGTVHLAIAGTASSSQPSSLVASPVYQGGNWTELESLGWAPRRRLHAAAAFDPKREQLVILGSDTHGWDWDMAVYRFDVSHREWLRSGTAEPSYTYRVDNAGIRVAGSADPVPWAMHGYQQVAIDTRRDTLWLVSAPLHNHVPTPDGARDVPWTFDLRDADWKPQVADAHPPVFFEAIVVYDAGRDTLVASAALQRPVAAVAIGQEGRMPRGGVWELGPGRQRWLLTSGPSPHGPDSAGVFDSRDNALQVFESHGHFMVHRYSPSSIPGGAGSWSTVEMPDGDCAHSLAYPPVPAAYAQHLDRTVLLPVARDGKRRTCVYDARQHQLTDLHIEPPPDVSMNFTMTYDPLHQSVYLVTGDPYGAHPARVWRLQLD